MVASAALSVPSSGSSGRVELIADSRWVPGFWPGRSEPCHRLRLHPLPVCFQEFRMSRLIEAWVAATGVNPADTLPEADLDAHVSPWLALASLSTAWLRVAGLPISESPTFGASDNGGGLLVLPAWTPQRRTNPETLLTLASVGHQLALGAAIDRVIPSLRAHHERLGRYAPRGSNTPRFVRAAYTLGVPRIWLAAELHQYGMGSRQRWLDSTFTDTTPSVSVRIARYKPLAHQVLTGAGLPVAQQQQVGNADQAVEVAQSWGWPVVIKPADLDGGRGVAADLRDADEVRLAYAEAARISKNILIEPHIPGRDYRLTVVDGELFWAVQRIPGGVTGDGRHTVRHLLDALNREPTRGKGPHAPLKPIVADAEANAKLGHAGLGWDDVPAAGQFVALRRIANTSTGGTPVAVLPQVHPDNAALAVRAAAALRLDVAGVDLLIPDIAISWRESGATICEVNAQPHLGGTITGPHIYGDLLERWFPAGARVPVIVLLGRTSALALCDRLMQALQHRGVLAGYVNDDSHGLGRQGQEPWANRFAAEQRLLREPALQALILVRSTHQWPDDGWPVDRVDQIVFSDLADAPRSRADTLAALQWFQELAAFAATDTWRMHAAAPGSWQKMVAQQHPAAGAPLSNDELTGAWVDFVERDVGRRQR